MRVHINLEHMIRIAVGQEIVGTDDLCGVIAADPKQVRRRDDHPTYRTNEGEQDEIGCVFQELHVRLSWRAMIRIRLVLFLHQ